MRRYGLSDSQREQIKGSSPGARRSCRRESRLGDGKNVHRRLRRWCEGGVTERIFRHLAADHDNEYMMTESTIVRAHQHSAGTRKKGEGHGSGHRAIPGWLTHEDPRHCRCGRKGHDSVLTPGQGRISLKQSFSWMKSILQLSSPTGLMTLTHLIEKLEDRRIAPVILSGKNRRNPWKIRFSLHKKETRPNGSSPD